MDVSGDFVGTTSLRFAADGVPGEVNIFHPEEQGGVAEIDYQSGSTAIALSTSCILVGMGRMKHIVAACRLVCAAIMEYQKRYYEQYGTYPEYIMYPDNRDGFGSKREKVLAKYLPTIPVGAQYED